LDGRFNPMKDDASFSRRGEFAVERWSNEKLRLGKHREDSIILPALWMRRFLKLGSNGDEHAAYATAAWLRRADRDGSLASFFKPPLTLEEREVAAVEGWILGVV
jgi:hypothetical protein